MILEKSLHLPSAKLAGRQADVMDNQQRHFAQRTLIEVGGRAVLNTFAPATGGIQPHNKLL
jgi:hypothetical protein